MRSVVIVSNLVDSTIKEYQRDTKFYIFKTLEELDEFTYSTPIRANIMYFTKDAIPLANSSLNYLVTLLNRVFLKVDSVVYITEKDSDEIKSVNFLIDVNGYDNWSVEQGPLTREFVSGIINGTGRDDNSTFKRKAVYRVARDEYVAHRTRHSDLLSSERYKDDDEKITEMPDEVMPVYVPPERVYTCECFDVIGEDSIERTVFTYIVAQYLSFTGKTLILERDVEYHRLGDIVTKSGVDCDIYYVDDILSEPMKVIDRIRSTDKKLVCCICKSRVKYNYSFIFNLIYNNLSDCLMHIIREGDFGEEPTEDKYTVVFENTMVGLLKMCEKINLTTLDMVKFVSIHMQSLQELRLPNSSVITKIVSDVLNDKINPIELISITSLKIGGDSTYDIRRILE